jgi:PAS domain S-box-containing protein
MGIDLGRVFDALPSMVWTMLPDGQFQFVNRCWVDFTGLGKDNDRPWKWHDAIEPDDLPKLLERWQAIRASGEAGDIEARILCRKGGSRNFLIQCSPVHDDGGAILEWCAVATDMEAFVERCKPHSLPLDFQQVIDSIPVQVAVTTPTGEVEGHNKLTLTYFGKAFDELKGWKASDVVHPDDLKDTISAQRAAHAAGTSYNVESRHLRADGVYRWHNVLGLPLRNNAGEIQRWLHLLIDIEDRKRAEDALVESERQSRLVVEGIPGLVISFSPNGYLESANDQTLDYVGQSLEDFRNWTTNGTVHPDDLQDVLPKFAHALATGEPYEYEVRIRRHDGLYHWFHIRGNPTRDEVGNILRWYGLMTDVDGRRRTEEALRQSERQLREIVSTIPGLIVILGADGRLEGANEQTLEYVGQTLDEFKNWATNGSVHPDDIEGGVAIFTHSLVCGQPYDFEVRIKRYDGAYRWFQVRGNPSRDAEGNIVSWYGLMTDIDDRKQAEIALAHSERESRLIVQTVAGMVALFTPDGQLNGGNQQLLDYFQLPLEEVAKWATNGITHPDDLQHCIGEFTRSLVTGEPYNFETRFRRHDGVYRWFLIRGHPLHDASGKIVRWYGLLTDIDDRKHIEEELRRSQTFLATGQRISQTGTFSWRVDPDQVMFSEELYRIFDFEEGIAVTLDMVVDRVHPDDRPTLTEKMARVRNGFDNSEYEIRLRRPNGGIKFVRVIGRVVHHRDGRKESLGAVQDITEWRLAEEARDQLRMELARVTGIMSLGQMAASIAHEVNQPLAGIIANATTCLHVLSLEPPNIDIALETTRRTIRDGNRAADVITRLRALFSKRKIVFEPVDLNEAVQEVIALSSSDLQRSSVVVRTEFDPALPRVSGDRVQLQQVIMNLLRNANEAVSGIEDRPRLIEMRTGVDEEGDVRIAIRDNGSGFGQYDTQRMFEAFYTTKSDGMGIGLSVSRSIIETHNGRLWAEANNGPGVTLYACIPPFSEEQMDDLPPRDGAPRFAENEMRTS